MVATHSNIYFITRGKLPGELTRPSNPAICHHAGREIMFVSLTS